MAVGPILVVNAGSSSLKFATYDRPSGALHTSGQVAQIGGAAELRFGGLGQPISAADHGAALTAVLAKLGEVSGPPSAVGHRVVHGGTIDQPARITADIHAQITAAAAMAPLHNPPALKVIDALQALHPDLPQVACFDTAFHGGNPPEATTFALPATLRAQGVRRYGFHGLSYASVIRRFSALTGQPLPQRLLVFHLGAGASIAAVAGGKGVATTMGFSPLDGLTMATRAGSLDPGLVLYLLKQAGMSLERLETLLNFESGLLALAGTPDMKTLLDTDSDAARFAVSHFTYWAARHAGAMIAAMQGVDGMVFTGGIGENAAPIRAAIQDRLRWVSSDTQLPVWVIPADEEGEIAQAVMALIAPASKPVV